MDGTKTLDDVPVMYVSFFGNPAENDAFPRLESHLASLRGRKFYGVSFWDSDEYRACVRLCEGDEPDRLGIQTATIPGGLYAYRRLKGDYDEIVTQIPATFADLRQNHPVDRSRPAVEFYRRHTEFLIYLPVTA